MKKLTIKIAALAFTSVSMSLGAQTTKSIIQDYLQKTSKTVQQPEFDVINEDPSKSLGSNIVKIQRTVNGIPVFNSVSTALVQEGKVKGYTDGFTSAKSVQKHTPDSRGASFAKVASEFKLTAYDFVDRITEENHNAEATPVIYEKTYFEKDGTLVLADQYQFEDKGGVLWLFIVGEANGEVLLKERLTLSCNFHHDAYRYEGNQIFPQQEPSVDLNRNSVVLAPVNASYNVFPLPYESPNSGSRKLLTNPWILNASPEGWHYVKTPTSESHVTYTRSNNVHATEDLDGSNVTLGNPAEGGAARNFDFPLDLTKPAINNLDASITNLFYVNNMVHDILYEFGFTETARNFQYHNFGKGGEGADMVLAQAQDASGINNANFSTPPDGNPARMQMYLWEGPVVNRLFYNSPPQAIAIKPETKDATFGPKLNATGVTADIIAGSPLNGCTAYPGDFFKNKIALIERGTCNFTEKVFYAQMAGAKAVVIYNQNTTATFGTMGGTPAFPINIPSILINYNDGNYLKSLIAAGPVNVTLRYNASENIQLDGSFDNGIVIHEYGHGLSNRLTGTGPGCLSTSVSAEQMGEGWSDFLALMLTNRPGDNAGVSRGVGSYAMGQNSGGSGLRPARYSPNFSVNNYTYGKTNGMEFLDSSTSTMTPDVHSIGFIWATMLWDLHWNFAAKYGYASDVLSNRNSGSGKVLQLVIDGMKLQACNPTFIDGRDAILAADLAANQGENKCMIWSTFAKRGLGVNASAGDAKNINDQVEDFNIPGECIGLATDEIKVQEMQLYPNPAQNYFKLKLPVAAKGRYTVSVFDISGKIVLTKTLGLTDTEISTSSLPNGMYMVKAEDNEKTYTTKLLIKR